MKLNIEDRTITGWNVESRKGQRVGRTRKKSENGMKQKEVVLESECG